MQEPHDDHRVDIEREIRIAARQETIFRYFTDPVKMLRWKGVSAILDPHPGGVYRVRIGPGAVVRGEYRTVEPFDRVVFSWGWEDSPSLPPGASTVDIRLIPDGDGTIVRLRHCDLPAAERPGQRMGWEHFLPRLIAVTEGRDTGPDHWMSAAPANPDDHATRTG